MTGERAGAPERPEIVCLCGSTRFVAELRAANRALTFAGVIVLAPGEAGTTGEAGAAGGAGEAGAAGAAGGAGKTGEAGAAGGAGTTGAAGGAGEVGGADAAAAVGAADATAAITDAQKAVLDTLHLRKIDLADRVLVVNPGGYVGESTRREIAYARATGKPVEFTDPA